MLAAVGKAVGRDIENAHHVRLVEPDDPLAALQWFVMSRHIAEQGSGPNRQRLRKGCRPFRPLGKVDQPPQIRFPGFYHLIFNLRKPN